MPEDYIHRVGRTARAELTGDAFTFVSPEEEGDLRAIERAIGKRLPRVTLPDFDYSRRGAEKLEIPLAERIAAIRARKAEERARAKANAERRGQHQASQGQRPGAAPQVARRARTAGAVLARQAVGSSRPRRPIARIIREPTPALTPALSLAEGEGAISIPSPPGERVG